MKGRWTVVALTLGVGLSPALAGADRAVPRGGGSSDSSRGGSHHSGGGAHSSSDRGSSSGGGRHDSAVPRTDAQRRHPRPGTGTGDFYRGGRGYSFGSPYFYGRRYYSNYYDPFFYGYYGYSPFYYSGYYGYAPYYYRARYRDSGSLRVIVDPEQTRVYVDGYYAGIADDFDGIFQRLHLPPGRHEVTLRLDGYQSHRFRVYVPVDQTIKIHHVMQRGTGETTDEVVGDPAQYERRDDDDYDRDDRWDRRDRDDDLDGDRDRSMGTLRLDLEPADASVYVDGEFRGSGPRAQNLRLPPGRHRIEVVRPGYRTVEREVEIRAGEWTSLEVELSR